VRRVDRVNPSAAARAYPGMHTNTATWDRALRALAGAAMLGASIAAPWPTLAHVIGLGVGGGYMLATALLGTCLGYKLIGVSTCPIERRDAAR